MKLLSRPLALLIFAILFGCATEGLPPATPAEAVARHMDPLVEKGRIVGAAVAVVHESEIETFYVGRADADTEEPPDGETLWEIGSISKVFTGTLLALLTQQGALNLEDAITPALNAAGVATGKLPPITFAQLAEHTSGLPRLPDNIKPADPRNPYADYSVEDMYAFLSNATLQRSPGEVSEYSNFGVGLLGHLLALKQGRPYEELVSTQMLAPLQMDDTAIVLSEAQKAKLAVPYARKGEEASNWDIPTLAGAGGWRSTLPDMAAFLKAAMGDAPEPLAEAFRLAQTPRFKVEANVHIGLCWMITESSVPASPPLVWHNGKTGGYASFLGFRQDGSIGIVLLSNTASDAVDQAAVNIMRDIAAMGH